MHLLTNKAEKAPKTFGIVIQSLIAESAAGIAVISGDGYVIYTSPAVKKVLGYTNDEALGLDTFTLTHPDESIPFANTMAQVFANPGVPVKVQSARLLHKDNSWIWVEATITNMLVVPEINGIVVNFRDITEQKLAEGKILNAKRLYAFISKINHTIVHATNEQAIFKEACRIAVETGKFEMAWIGKLDEQNRKLNLVAHRNIPLAEVELFSDMAYSEDGPVSLVLKSDAPYIINDYSLEPLLSLWAQYAFTRGFQSAITLPIRRSGRITYMLSLFSGKANFFNEQEIALLEEATSDISFALDVFEKEKSRALAEQKLKHSELRMTQAQEIAHIGSWELDFSTGIATWSEEACKIYGLSPEDNLQSYESWLSFIHPEDAINIIKITKEATATLSNINFRHRIIRTDGITRHIHTYANVEFSNEGVPLGLYGVAHDITEMIEKEKALKLSQANLRLIIDLIPQPIFKKDYNGRFLYVNKSFADLHGLTPDQMINKTIAEVKPGLDQYTYFLEHDQEIINSGQTKIFPQLQFTDHTGKERTFRTTKVPYTISGTTEKAILSISQDITEQIQADEERNKMIEDIVQRNKDLEQFSYIISHNLRAPVANILGLTTLMQTMKHNEDEEKIVMDGLYTSAEKLDMVIRDLNKILQVKQNVDEQKEMVKCSQILYDIQSGMNNLIKNEDVEIISDFTAVDQLHTIKSYWQSIFFNLISNSIKYRNPNIKPVIEISSIKEKNKVSFTFKDNGLGIDLTKKGDQVFGLYKRFHNHTEGKGMGLYMVKAQVETLGGKIMVDSEVNKGTTFTIVFENI